MLLHNSLMWLSVHQVTKVPEKLLSFAVRCKNLTVSNTRTVLLTPEIYVSQNVYEQLLDLLLEGFSGTRRFRIGLFIAHFFLSYVSFSPASHFLFLKQNFFTASHKVTLCFRARGGCWVCGRGHCRHTLRPGGAYLWGGDGTRVRYLPGTHQRLGTVPASPLLPPRCSALFQPQQRYCQGQETHRDVSSCKSAFLWHLLMAVLTTDQLACSTLMA